MDERKTLETLVLPLPPQKHLWLVLDGLPASYSVLFPVIFSPLLPRVFMPALKYGYAMAGLTSPRRWKYLRKKG